VFYTERLEVGYRWYHAHDIKPKFPFGHGLSYTAFTYTGIAANATTVTFTVTNTGGKDGGEIPQLYLDFPPAAEEPAKQLKGFTKIYLGKGASQQVLFPLAVRDKSIWNVGVHGWEEMVGTFTAHVGASSGDMRLSTTFVV
jgi:beta-glucosidase